MGPRLRFCLETPAGYPVPSPPTLQVKKWLNRDNTLPCLRKASDETCFLSLCLWQPLLQAFSKLSCPLSLLEPSRNLPQIPIMTTQRVSHSVVAYWDYSLWQFLLLVHTQPLDINQNYHLILLLGFWLLWLISKEAGVGCDLSGNCPHIPLHSAVSVQEKSLMSSCFCCFLILVTFFKVFSHESCENKSLNSLWCQ